MAERAVYVGSAHELHVRLVGGALLKATVRNDGTAFAYEEGTPVTLYLPSDAVRVLTRCRLPRRCRSPGGEWGGGRRPARPDRPFHVSGYPLVRPADVERRI